MPTIYQRYKNGTLKKKDNSRTPALKACPQVRGTVMRARIVTPRKPNSAKRPVGKVVLVNRKRVTAHIPGIGHNIRRYSKVFVRGGGARDLPGVRYSLMRGCLDFDGLPKKKRRRSIYAAPQPDYAKGLVRRNLRKTLEASKLENEMIEKRELDKQNAALHGTDLEADKVKKEIYEKFDMPNKWYIIDILLVRLQRCFKDLTWTPNVHTDFNCYLYKIYKLIKKTSEHYFYQVTNLEKYSRTFHPRDVISIYTRRKIDKVIVVDFLKNIRYYAKMQLYLESRFDHDREYRPAHFFLKKTDEFDFNKYRKNIVFRNKERTDAFKYMPHVLSYSSYDRYFETDNKYILTRLLKRFSFSVNLENPDVAKKEFFRAPKGLTVIRDKTKTFYEVLFKEKIGYTKKKVIVYQFKLHHIFINTFIYIYFNMLKRNCKNDTALFDYFLLNLEFPKDFFKLIDLKKNSIFKKSFNIGDLLLKTTKKYLFPLRYVKQLKFENCDVIHNKFNTIQQNCLTFNDLYFYKDKLFVKFFNFWYAMTSKYFYNLRKYRIVGIDATKNLQLQTGKKNLRGKLMKSSLNKLRYIKKIFIRKLAVYFAKISKALDKFSQAVFYNFYPALAIQLDYNADKYDYKFLRLFNCYNRYKQIINYIISSSRNPNLYNFFKENNEFFFVRLSRIKQYVAKRIKERIEKKDAKIPMTPRIKIDKKINLRYIVEHSEDEALMDDNNNDFVYESDNSELFFRKKLTWLEKRQNCNEQFSNIFFFKPIFRSYKDVGIKNFYISRKQINFNIIFNFTKDRSFKKLFYIYNIMTKTNLNLKYTMITNSGYKYKHFITKKILYKTKKNDLKRTNLYFFVVKLLLSGYVTNFNRFSKLLKRRKKRKFFLKSTNKISNFSWTFFINK